MNGISDFDDAGRWVVEIAFKERYGKRTTPKLADSEIKPDPGRQ